VKPPPELKAWSKNDLVREVARLRAVLHEFSERSGDDPRAHSTSDPIIGGSPTGRGDALLDARAAVLLEHVEVVLVDTKRDTEPSLMMLSLAGRVNYADDRVTHAYLFNGDGAAGIVAELVALAGRASGIPNDLNAQAFAADFRLALDRRMNEHNE
jgi:hypothetical protein